MKGIVGKQMLIAALTEVQQQVRRLDGFCSVVDDFS